MSEKMVHPAKGYLSARTLGLFDRNEFAREHGPGYSHNMLYRLAM
jgi:hypothetical protein